MQVFGVDFSGGKDAARKVWVTEPGDPPRSFRPGGILALRDFIAARADGVFGLDFPFSLPAPLVPDATWVEFALAFGQRYPSAEDLRAACRAAAGGRELRRATDVACRTPFSPYNLRLYRQTYHGIRDLLAPLVAAGRACVLPMMKSERGKPWLIEICPASTLKRLGLYEPYKGRAHRDRRACLQAHFQPGACLPDDDDGDALDSLIAAWATRQALPRLQREAAAGVEGFVYV